jgi:hypothetical protein
MAVQNVAVPYMSAAKPLLVQDSRPYGKADCGSSQGRSDIETADAANLRRGFHNRVNAGPGRKMPFPEGHG